MIVKIKDSLYSKEDKIKEILDDIGCKDVRKSHTKNEFRFGFNHDGSSSGNVLDIDTLKFTSFSGKKSGDIITLTSEIKNIELGEAIKWLANKLNIKKGYSETKPKKLPFGGFFKEFVKDKSLDEIEPKIYDKSILKEYTKHGVSKLFIDDGISALTQEKYNIGYDIISDRITIPWMSPYGDGIIGIMGRKNKIELSEKDSKYLPIIEFMKSKALYGFYENYSDILNSECIIICESEKSPMKGTEIGINNVVALGGNNISSYQAKLIKSMFCKVIIALDEDMTLKHCAEQAQKVKIKNVFFENEVYVVDMDNPYVKDKKVSLLDLDLETINKILDEHLIYIG